MLRLQHPTHSSPLPLSILDNTSYHCLRVWTNDMLEDPIGGSMGDTPPIGSISEVGSVLLKKTMVWKSGGGQNRREIDMDVVERTPMDSDSDEVPAPPFPPKMMRKSSISLKVVMAEVDGGGPTASKVKGKGKEKAQPPPEYSATEPNAEIACVKSRPKVEAIQSGHPYVSWNHEFFFLETHYGTFTPI